jgi:Fic family protein
VSLDQAIKLGQRGRPKKGEEKGSNPTISKRGRDYDLARLDRDGHAERLLIELIVRTVQTIGPGRPGQGFTMEQIATQLGVSQSTITEDLRSLSTIGLATCG